MNLSGESTRLGRWLFFRIGLLEFKINY